MSAKKVYQRLDGGASKSSQLSYNKALSLEQEQVLGDCIRRLNKQSILAKVSITHAAANFILTKSHSDHLTSPPQVSAIWTKRFLDCYLQFHKKKQKPLIIKYRIAHNKKDL